MADGHVMDTLPKGAETVMLPGQEGEVRIGELVRAGKPPFGDIGDALKPLLVGAELNVVAAPGLVYPLRDEAQLRNPFDIVEGSKELLWVHLVHLLNNPVKLSGLSSGSRFAAQIRGSGDNLTVFGKIDWKGSQGHHSIGRMPENDPKFSFYPGTFFIVRTG